LDFTVPGNFSSELSQDTVINCNPLQSTSTNRIENLFRQLPTELLLECINSDVSKLDCIGPVSETGQESSLLQASAKLLLAQENMKNQGSLLQTPATVPSMTPENFELLNSLLPRQSAGKPISSIEEKIESPNPSLIQTIPKPLALTKGNFETQNSSM